jgi:hypothetical protein
MYRKTTSTEGKTRYATVSDHQGVCVHLEKKSINKQDPHEGNKGLYFMSFSMNYILSRKKLLITSVQITRYIAN